MKLCDILRDLKAILICLLFMGGVLQAALPVNALVLEQTRSMPKGGGYALTARALEQLRTSVVKDQTGAIRISSHAAVPSFCSGATYLVFLKTLEQLQQNGQLALGQNISEALAIRGQRDGEGVWGRWNANGPGTARLFHELGLGISFEDYARAQPGDFMKIFWSAEIGKFERGHLVVYLGLEQVNGTECVRFWSSNLPGGYGEKSVPKAKIARAIFSRLQAPENLVSIETLPKTDRFLAEMLNRRANIGEVRQKCGIQ